MMDNSLQNAMENLIEDRTTSDELELLREAFANGKVFIGGNVRNSIVIVGSGNTVELNDEMLARLNNADTSMMLSTIHQLPQPPLDFTGRQNEIKKLSLILNKKETSLQIGFFGMGGIGKTAIGLVFAHDLINKFIDAQFFIDLKGTSKKPRQSTDVMKQIVQGFYPTADLQNSSKDELAGFYQSTLSEKNTLIFLDNIRDAAQIELLIPPKNCCLIVTSRWNITMPGMQIVKLDTMKPKEASKFLINICQRLTLKDAREISQLCGYLPIALRVAGSFLQVHKDWSVSEYIDELSNKKRRLPMLQFEGVTANVASTFEQSYRQLSNDEQKKWKVLSVFVSSFRRDAITDVWETDAETARKVASKLCQYGLLEYDSLSGRYHLHDLLIDFAKAKISPSDEYTATLNYFRHYHAVWNRAEDTHVKGGKNVRDGLALFDTEFTNIDNAYQWATEHMDDTNVLLILKKIPEFVYLTRTRIHPKLQISWFTSALIAAEKSDDYYNQNKILGNLGAAYSNLGDIPKSTDYFENALAMARKSQDRRREGFWLGNNGGNYENVGNIPKAIEYYIKALEIAREIDDQPRVGLWLGRIGGAYGVFGDNKKKIEYCEQALDFAHRSGNKQLESSWLGNIGIAYRDLGEIHKGIEYCEKALAISLEIGDRNEVGIHLAQLGTSYYDLGDAKKSIEYSEQALAIAREFGSKGNECLNLGLIGGSYIVLRELHKGIEYCEKALAISREIEDRRNESVFLGLLGDANGHLGDLNKRLLLYEQALAIAVETGDQRNEAQLLGAFGDGYFELGELDKSKKYYEQALEIVHQLNLRKNECELLNGLGELYLKKNDLGKAKDHFQRSLDIAKELNISNKAASCLFNFAKLEQVSQNKELALKYAEEARSIFNSIHSPELQKVIEFMETIKEK